MEFSFQCLCGEETVDLTRGTDDATNRSRIRCENCEAVYAVTITKIVTGSQEGSPTLSTE